MLLRLDELEKRLDELEFGEPDTDPPSEKSEIRNPESAMYQGLVTSAATNGEDDDRAARFTNRSLALSRIKRDGLKAGTLSPDFRLPRLDGGELSLEEFRGKNVLLVFSDPHCGPCNALAPKLEEFHRDHAELAIVMISRGGPKENRAKVREHGLTFPIVLQQRWEISRLYAMFATPIAYLVDESGFIAADVAVGLEPILNLMARMQAPDPIAG
jgi:peroxiredoxin